jgi:hypothetical protein
MISADIKDTRKSSLYVMGLDANGQIIIPEVQLVDGPNTINLNTNSQTIYLLLKHTNIRVIDPSKSPRLLDITLVR